MIERTSTKFVNQATDLIRCYKIANSRLYEIALGLVRFDHVVRAASKTRITAPCDRQYWLA
jgi:hypothetical protein